MTADRVRWAVGSFSHDKSPGTDGAFPVLLQSSVNDAVGPLVKLARTSPTLGYVSEVLRGMKLYSFLKRTIQ